MAKPAPSQFDSERKTQEIAPKDMPSGGIFTIESLRPFNGLGKPICMGICGKVFNVSSSANIKPGEGYGDLWAGKEATYSLATQSLQPEDANKLDFKLSDFTQEQRKALSQWYKHFVTKYPIVGTMKEYEGFDFGSVAEDADAVADSNPCESQPGSGKGSGKGQDSQSANPCPFQFDKAPSFIAGQRVCVYSKNEPEIAGREGIVCVFEEKGDYCIVELDGESKLRMFPCRFVAEPTGKSNPVRESRARKFDVGTEVCVSSKHVPEIHGAEGKVYMFNSMEMGFVVRLGGEKKASFFRPEHLVPLEEFKKAQEDKPVSLKPTTLEKLTQLQTPTQLEKPTQLEQQSARFTVGTRVLIRSADEPKINGTEGKVYMVKESENSYVVKLAGEIIPRSFKAEQLVLAPNGQAGGVFEPPTRVQEKPAELAVGDRVRINSTEETEISGKEGVVYMKMDMSYVIRLDGEKKPRTVKAEGLSLIKGSNVNVG